MNRFFADGWEKRLEVVLCTLGLLQVLAGLFWIIYEYIDNKNFCIETGIDDGDLIGMCGFNSWDSGVFLLIISPFLLVMLIRVTRWIVKGSHL